MDLEFGRFSTHHFVHTVWAVVCVKYKRIQHSACTTHTIPSMYKHMAQNEEVNLTMYLEFGRFFTAMGELNGTCGGKNLNNNGS